jgi:hypothetical protein
MRSIATHAGLFLLLVACAVLAREGLVALGLGHWDRWLGIAGSALILVSFLYSLRKRKILRFGRPPAFLRAHEVLAWMGAMLVLVHGGARMAAILPWLAQAAMLVVVASGLTGKYLLQAARKGLAERKKALAATGLDAREVEERVLLEATIVGKMTRWRAVHIPLTILFAIAALAHAASALLFWRW